MNKIFQNFSKFQVVIKNFFSLFIIQSLNYILPLITIPHIFNAVGVDLFGLLAIATSMISYFVIITNYGFQLSATKEISVYRNNQKKLNEIFTSVFIIKFILMIICFLFIFIIVSFFDFFKTNQDVYFCTAFIILGHLLFPVWYFQGIEKMKYITYFTVFSKILFTILIFIYVEGKEDYLLIPIFLGGGQVIAGLFSLVFLFAKFNLRFSKIKLSFIIFYLNDGFHVFLGSLYATIYTSGNIFVLGLLSNPTLVGFYSVAERIVSAISGLFIPFNQAIYPYMAKILKQDKKIFIIYVKKMIPLILMFSSILFVLTVIFRNTLIDIISKERNVMISILIVILAFRILSAPFGAYFSNMLILLNKKSEYTKIMNLTVILNVIIVLPSIYFFNTYGLAVSFILLLYIHAILLYRKVKTFLH